MKKNLLFSSILMLGLALAGCGGVPEHGGNSVKQNVDSNKENTGMEADAPKMSEDQQGNNANVNITEITETEAKNIALKHAQISEAEVKRLRIVKEHDDGRQMFDVDFSVGNKEYDYDIDLYTGEILSIDLDIEDDFNSNQNTVKDNKQNIEKDSQQNTQKDTQQNSQSKEPSSNLISKSEAIALVLKKVAGATEKNVEIELDEDDGKWKYEGEIRYEGREYDFEINAQNGKILEWSEEVDD